MPEREEPRDGQRFQLADHERRITRLEKFEPAVVAQKLAELDKDLHSVADDTRSLRRAFYTFCFGAVGSAIVFAFAVFALLGRHP